MQYPLILMGHTRCGLSLLSAIVGCSKKTITTLDLLKPYSHLEPAVYILQIDPQTWFQHGVELLNLFHISNAKCVWTCRDPMNSVCSIINNYKLQPIDAANYWIDVNTLYWYFFHSFPKEYRHCIKYEHMLLSSSSIKKLFTFADIEYDKQYLRFGDFDHGSRHVLGEKILLERINPYDKFHIKEMKTIIEEKNITKFWNYSISLD